MENILSALYFVAMLGWIVFLVSVVFGIAPKLFTGIMREYVEKRRLFACILYSSYAGTVLSLLGVIALNALMTILVFLSEAQVQPTPLAIFAFAIGLAQVLGIWGPTVKAIFIYYILKDRELRDKEEDE